jgi:hypothetical protein
LRLGFLTAGRREKENPFFCGFFFANPSVLAFHKILFEQYAGREASFFLNKSQRLNLYFSPYSVYSYL